MSNYDHEEYLTIDGTEITVGFNAPFYSDEIELVWVSAEPKTDLSALIDEDDAFTRIIEGEFNFLYIPGDDGYIFTNSLDGNFCELLSDFVIDRIIGELYEIAYEKHQAMLEDYADFQRDSRREVA